MDPNLPPVSNPVAARILRRRKRAGRLKRALGGKQFQSWAEYGPKTLHSTGDYSALNRWAYVLMFSGAILAVPLVIGLLALQHPHVAAMSSGEQAFWLLGQLMPFLILAALLPVLLGLSLIIRHLWR